MYRNHAITSIWLVTLKYYLVMCDPVLVAIIIIIIIIIIVLIVSSPRPIFLASIGKGLVNTHIQSCSAFPQNLGSVNTQMIGGE